MEYVRSVRLAMGAGSIAGTAVIATLRHRDFALLWTAGLISVAGDFALLIALPLHAYALTGSAVATGGVLPPPSCPGLSGRRRGLRRSLGPQADDGRGRSLARGAAAAAAGRGITGSSLAALPGARGHRCRWSHLRPGGISPPAPPGRRRAVGHRQRAQRTQQQHRPSRGAGGRRVALCRRRAAGGGHR